MNIHHLELFYYVARHRGIVAACRQIPYGIQQPAVSGQIAALEADLGVRLFHRRPFQLTPQGQRLYEFAAPFFAKLGDVEAELRGELSQELRLAGPTEVLRDHLPAVIAEMRRSHAKLRLHLQEADQQTAEELVGLGEADLAITILEEKAPQGVRTEVLIRLPMVLLVAAESGYKSAAAVIRDGVCGKLSLIALPPHERLPRMFKDHLRRQEMSWPVSMEVSSNDLVALYVSNGLGAGLSVRTPGLELLAGVRELAVTKAPPLPIGVFWRGKLSPVAAAFAGRLRERAAGLGNAA